MGLFTPKRKPDPILERSKVLSAEIAALEEEIRQLDHRILDSQTQPRLRSTAVPGSSPFATVREPVFEDVNHTRVKTENGSESSPHPCNELGVRKFDLGALWRRLQSHAHGPSANNPKLVNYLAAGSIQGLRPLRYEKRVARNRVIALTAILFLVLWGILDYLLKH